MPVPLSAQIVPVWVTGEPAPGLERPVAYQHQRVIRFIRIHVLPRLHLPPVTEEYLDQSKTGAELQFEVFSQRYERGSILVTTNLPFDEWTEVFGSERLTHRVHILEMNGESYRLRESRRAMSLSITNSESTQDL